MVDISASSGGMAVNNSGDGNVNIVVSGQIAKLPSVLSPLLMKVVEHYRPQYDPNVILEKSPRIEEKILFNKLKYYAEDVRLNSEFMAIIEDAFSAIDDESPGSKSTIQWTINRSYKEVKRQVLISNNIDPWDAVAVGNVISDNSDKIFKHVLDDVFTMDFNDLGCDRELLIAAQELLVCYGFISCMILEEPNNDK
ncbi:hypothetical protein [Serratia quinivorans]|uniref:hypothetical protein n=1 Tax=Serratia quinivorans TaxID=137545 RepID=UPI00217BFBA1|nr:hypothetical protein [Serratia quinivorans]CAI1026499.1 Uncharacterised protein [Serratia quinivorans]CAI1785956.1 Uncharacterised protein [Serratia quinivorans]